MYIKVRITEPCITPKYDWQSMFSVFNFLLSFLCLKKLLKNDKQKSNVKIKLFMQLIIPAKIITW